LASRSPGQDDPLDLLGLQRLDGGGHGQVALARAGRADADGDGVPGDGVDIALLAGALRPDAAAPGALQHLVGQHLGRALAGAHDVDRLRQGGGRGQVPGAQQPDLLLDQPAGLAGGGPVDGELVAAQEDVGVRERSLDEPEQLVGRAEQRREQRVVGDGHDDGLVWHPAFSGSAYCRTSRQ
jgi:hypothetical protein